MTIGSQTAYLNGTAIKLDRAPMIIYNYEAKASYVMVPGNVTANCLGYDYTWNKTKSVSAITTKELSTEPGNSQGGNGSPELGDSGNNATGLILKEWSSPEDIFGKSSGQYALNQGLTTVGDNGLIYTVNRDYTNVKQNVETYMVVATMPFEKITSGQNGQNINITAQNKLCLDNTYQIYGSTGNYVQSITTTSHAAELYSSIDFNILPENYTYDITLSQDKLIMFVTVYINGLTRATLGTNDQGDYLTLTGLNALKVNLSEQNGMLMLELPYTTNGIGDQNMTITGAKYLSLLYTISNPEKIQLVLGMASGTRYFVSQEGNQYTVTFQNQSAVKPPSNDEDTVINDPGKYEIILPKPAGITRSLITDEDDYYHNRFSIRIPGDYTALIANAIRSNSGVIKDISVFLNNSNETEIRITTTKLQGYEYVTDQDNIYINIGNPRDIYPNIVVLDPGHGGPANGAQYYGSNEKDFNLAILYEIGKKYFNNDPSKLKVYYTRQTDMDLTLAERAAYASKMGADLFVSLHMNASTASSAYGTEVYYSENNNQPNAAGLTSKTLANIMVNNLCNGVGTLNRGYKSEKYTVVHRNTVPAVLIELGFLSNKNDYAKLSDPAFRDNAVRTIYETLLQVFEQYPTGR
jgi:N-acetylmuramoyl-L-alanine amidase